MTSYLLLLSQCGVVWLRSPIRLFSSRNNGIKDSGKMYGPKSDRYVVAIVRIGETAWTLSGRFKERGRSPTTGHVPLSIRWICIPFSAF
jgi:hypothetical protein